MTLSFLLALLLDRKRDLYDALFVAAFLILVVTPAALFDISFQLSFLAVLAILSLWIRARGVGPMIPGGSEVVPGRGCRRSSPWPPSYVTVAEDQWLGLVASHGPFGYNRDTE